MYERMDYGEKVPPSYSTGHFHLLGRCPKGCVILIRWSLARSVTTSPIIEMWTTQLKYSQTSLLRFSRDQLFFTQE